MTGYTIVVPSVFEEEVDKVRTRGYARSVDETEVGMSSLAVPVRSGPGGDVVAAISVVGPTARVAGAGEATNVATLLAAAKRLGEALEHGDYRLPPRRRR